MSNVAASGSREDDVRRKTYRLLGPDGAFYDSVTPGLLGGHAKQRIYGRLDCRAATRALARSDTYRKHRVFFADEAAALATGYRPCGVCLRPQYQACRAATK